MSHNWPLYIIAFGLALIVTLIATPWAKKISVRLGAIDYPKERGIHKKPMPRMGGVAIVLGFMITVNIVIHFVEGVDMLQFTGFIIGALIITVLGMIDDVKNLRASIKLAVQVVAALIVVLCGVRIDFVLWPVFTVLKPLSVPITMLWIIGVTNAVNLIDGMDGLAAGVSSIGALSIMVLCIMTGSEIAVVLTAALAGSCLGFLPRNFNPAEIFMGDTGATFLGFVLAVSSIMGVFKGYAILALLIAALCLGLPIFDTLFAMIRRAVHHKPIMTADRGHLHHRLIDKGYTQRQAVIILYGISVVCGSIAVLLVIQNVSTVLITCITAFVLSYLVYCFKLKNQKKD